MLASIHLQSRHEPAPNASHMKDGGMEVKTSTKILMVLCYILKDYDEGRK